MNPHLELRAAHSPVITPQQQQSLRLLQFSAAEFEQEILRALAQNPFLEREEDSDGGGAQAEADGAGAVASYDDFAAQHRSARGSGADDGADPGAYAAAPVSLQEHLLEQVRGSRLNEREALLAAVLVEALDDDGYLRQSLESLCALLPPEAAIEPPELEVALRFVQSLDPAGICARTAAECLELQLARLAQGQPERDLALAIVREHLEVLAAHDTPRLLRRLGCDEDALRRANALIVGLDPHPGSRFGGPQARYVVADVVVRKASGRWQASINPQVLPRIRLNELYAGIYRRARDGNPALGQQLQEARWLIRNAQQRFHTIHRVAQAIVDRQQRFLQYGDVAMKPLLQRDIARQVGVHESTISRVASGKYMTTPRGLFEFKHFFGSQFATEDGHTFSSTAIRALIRHIIAHESADAPLSDIKVTRRLGEYGMRVARRTVTKYRDAMRIPPVEARRLAAR